MEFEGEEICQEVNLAQGLAQKHNPLKEPSHRGLDGGYEITSRCISFKSPVARSYTQSNNSTSKQSENSNLMLFHLKFNQESNTKGEGDLLFFPTCIYFPSSDQWFW
jgi:hypothetical protein